jgi:shikimate dehydrogenase
MAKAEKYAMAAVLGWPVMHSRSPLLHNYWMEQYGLTGIYVPIEVKPRAIGEALKALHPLGFAGCNLTMPHKQNALPFLDEIDPVAQKIGAVSCIAVRDDGSLFGVNNDWFGFIENILEAQPHWRTDEGPIAVLGAGGGARAVVHGLVEKGAAEIRLINRSFDRALTIADEFGGPIKPVKWEERTNALAGCTMVVNATSQGMQGMDALDIDLSELPVEALAADIIYIPKETPFLAAARQRGNRTVNGLGMLLHQGRPAWKLWFGIDVEVTKELRAKIEATL